MTSHGHFLTAGLEKEGPRRKKAGLASFRLSGLKSRDQGGYTAQGLGPHCSPRDLTVGKGNPAKTVQGGGKLTSMGS